MRKLVQIYNMCASVSACVSVTDLCYNFPQGNLAMKPTYQKKTRLQDPWKQQSWNLRVWHFVFFVFFCFLVFFGFLGFPCLGQQYHPKMHKKNPLCTRSLFNLVFDGLSTPTENCWHHTRITLPRFENRRRKPISAWYFRIGFLCARVSLHSSQKI